METIKNDTLVLGGKEFRSRFILGSGKFSLQLIHDVMEYGGSEIATIALRRANADSPENILDFLPEHLTLLPNTSGARNADEAVRIARLSRALGCGDFVKVEVIPDAKYLLPDNAETIRATEILAKEGFHVLPYMYPDLIAARHLVDAGAAEALLSKGSSLLPGGVRQVLGNFQKGALVRVARLGESDGHASLGVGLSNYSAADLRKIMGLRRHEVAAILGDAHYPEVIHRDNLLMDAAI